MGSTEKQDTVEINKELENITGFKRIKVSYENIYHHGISQKLWKVAVNKLKDLENQTKTGLNTNGPQLG